MKFSQLLFLAMLAVTFARDPNEAPEAQAFGVSITRAIVFHESIHIILILLSIIRVQQTWNKYENIMNVAWPNWKP